MQAKEVKEKLKFLISEASPIDPSLAKRLHEISRWIKDTKDGSLNTKKIVMAFLLEVIEDSEVWLQLKLQSPEDQQSSLEQITPPARYWYSYLFPRWLNEPDAFVVCLETKNDGWSVYSGRCQVASSSS